MDGHPAPSNEEKTSKKCKKKMQNYCNLSPVIHWTVVGEIQEHVGILKHDFVSERKL